MSVEPLVSVIELLRDVGFLVYGGSMLSFTALITAASHRKELSPPLLVRAYRAWGPGLGLSLGMVIFGALTAHWLQVGAWSWVPSTGLGWTGMLAWMALLALWISNIVLEVWTLEPLRRLDPPDGGISDPTRWNDARVRLEHHLQLQSLFVLATFLFARLS